jgi:hypothetical protein
VRSREQPYGLDEPPGDKGHDLDPDLAVSLATPPPGSRPRAWHTPHSATSCRDCRARES